MRHYTRGNSVTLSDVAFAGLSIGGAAFVVKVLGKTVGALRGAKNVRKISRVANDLDVRRSLSFAADKLAANSIVDPNKLRHIFGKAAHKLDEVVARFGSQEEAFNAIKNATEETLRGRNMTGIFETVVQVGGQAVTVRGNIVNGVVRIGTAFIP